MKKGHGTHATERSSAPSFRLSGPRPRPPGRMLHLLFSPRGRPRRRHTRLQEIPLESCAWATSSAVNVAASGNKTNLAGHRDDSCDRSGWREQDRMAFVQEAARARVGPYAVAGTENGGTDPCGREIVTPPSKNVASSGVVTGNSAPVWQSCGVIWTTHAPSIRRPSSCWSPLCASACAVVSVSRKLSMTSARDTPRPCRRRSRAQAGYPGIRDRKTLRVNYLRERRDRRRERVLRRRRSDAPDRRGAARNEEKCWRRGRRRADVEVRERNGGLRAGIREDAY